MIGLISAMEEEVLLFRERSEIAETVQHAGIDFHVGVLGGHEVAVVRSGIGKVNAAVATQILVDRLGARAVIISGLAGSLVPTLRQGDVVVSNFVVQHDVDLTPFGRRAGEIPDVARLLEADPRLVHRAAEAFERLTVEESAGRTLVVGTIATGDAFVSDPSRSRWLQREFGAVAAEMEGGAVGQVCWMNGVPFVAIRIISDGGGEGAAGEFLQFLSEASVLAFAIVSGMLPHLHM
jgi:adenosylhomocysteine nucleosidase